VNIYAICADEPVKLKHLSLYLILKAETWQNKASEFWSSIKESRRSNTNSNQNVKQYEQNLVDFLRCFPPLTEDELKLLLALGDRTRDFKQRNISRLLSARCEELAGILRAPESHLVEYMYIDERDSGVYSLKNNQRYMIPSKSYSITGF
jgi:hypothetical protein